MPPRRPRRSHRNLRILHLFQAFTDLADGTYTFEVRATDSAQNTDQSPASRSFSVDTAAPQTQVDSGPQGPTSNNDPSFAFSSSEPNSSFECRLDGPGAATGTFASCTSPRVFTDLADGTYTFEVRATDSAATPTARRQPAPSRSTRHPPQPRASATPTPTPGPTTTTPRSRERPKPARRSRSTRRLTARARRS